MIFFLSGKDQFRRHCKLQEIKTQTLGNDASAFNYIEVVNPGLNEFAGLIQTPAFGGMQKIIVIKDFIYLEKKCEDAEIEKIITSFERRPQSNVIIFYNEKINGTIKLVKQIKTIFDGRFTLHDFEAFNAWDIKSAATWVMSIYPNLSEEKKSLSFSVAEHFVEQVGCEDSSKLYSELKRLILSGQEITEKLIDEQINSRHDIFKMIKLFAENKIAKANQELDKLINNKEINLGFLALAETIISKYLKIKLAKQQGLSKNQIAELLGTTPQRLYYQEQETSAMQIAHLEGVLASIVQTEFAVKTGRMPIEKAVKVLVNSSP